VTVNLEDGVNIIVDTLKMLKLNVVTKIYIKFKEIQIVMWKT